MRREFLVAALVASAMMMLALFQHQLRHDDLVICFESVHLPLWTYLWTPYGGHILPLHRIVYSVLRPLFGLSPAPYFLVAFTTHLASVVLLYRVIFRLTEREAWSAFWAGLWGTALPGVGTLVLFSTYGQAEALLFTLLVLDDLLAHRARGAMPSAARVGLWAVAMLCSALSAGIGTAAAFGTYVCAALLLRGEGARRAAALIGSAALLIFVSYMTLQRKLGDPTEFDPALTGFAAQAFGLLGAQGVADLLFPAVFSVGSGEHAVGPLKDESDALVTGITIAVALAAAVPAYLGLRSLSPERRRACLALSIIAAADYALIALGRSVPTHVFGGSPHSLAQAIRYHYFNLAFVAAAFAVALSQWKPLQRALGVRWLRYGLAAWGAVVLVTSCSVGRNISLDESEQAARARTDLVAQVEDAARKAPPGATVYIPNVQYSPTWFLFAVGVPHARFPNLAAAWVSDNHGGVVLGHEVRFVEPDPEVVRAVRERPESPAARLIVTANEAGEVLPSSLTLGQPGARSLVLRGIYDEDEKGYAWTALTFAVRLGASTELATRGGALTVDVYIPEIALKQHPKITLTPRLGGKPLTPHTFAEAAVATVVFDVPPGTLRPGEADIELSVDERVIAPGDDRELGILVHRFELMAR